MFPFLRRLTQTGVRLPGAGLNTYLSTLTGPDWASRFGDTTAGRVRQVGRCLVVTIGDTIVFPGGTTTVSIFGDATGAFVAGTLTWTATGAGYIYAITTNLDLYECGEGSESTIYSSARANKQATLSGITWDYQSKYPHPANARGYRLSGSVIVPMLLDGSGYADDGALTGGYVGKVAWPGKFRQFGAFKTPSGVGNVGIMEATDWTEGGRTTLTVSCWVKVGGTASANFTKIAAQKGGVTYGSAGFSISALSQWIRGDIGGVAGNTISATIPANTWLCVAMVYNGSLAYNAGRIKIYLNGVLLSNLGAVATTPTSLSVESGIRWCTGQPFAVAQTYNRSASYRGLRVYGEALTDSQVAAICTDSLDVVPRLMWMMDECLAYADDAISAGTVAQYARISDVSGNDRYGTVQQGTGLVDYCDYGSPWCLIHGWTLWSFGAPGSERYRYVPWHRVGSSYAPIGLGTDTWTHPETGTVYTRVREYPAIVNGWNGITYKLNFFPSYVDTTVAPPPCEVKDVYDLVEDRGGTFPAYTASDFSLTFAETLAMKTDTVDATIRRRMCVRTNKNTAGVTIGLDRIVNYTQQLAKNLWAILLRWNRSITR